MDLVLHISEHIVIHNLRKIMKYLILIWGSPTIISRISLLHCLPLLFLTAQYIYSCLLVFLLLSQKLSLFIGVLTSTWTLDTLSLQRNICQNIHTSDITLSHKNHSHLNILEDNSQAKPLGLEFQIPQVLCKSTKSVRIGTKILVAESFSWNSFTYMYMY